MPDVSRGSCSRKIPCQSLLLRIDQTWNIAILERRSGETPSSAILRMDRLSAWNSFAEDRSRSGAWDSSATSGFGASTCWPRLPIPAMSMSFSPVNGLAISIYGHRPGHLEDRSLCWSIWHMSVSFGDDTQELCCSRPLLFCAGRSSAKGPTFLTHRLREVTRVARLAWNVMYRAASEHMSARALYSRNDAGY